MGIDSLVGELPIIDTRSLKSLGILEVQPLGWAISFMAQPGRERELEKLILEANQPVASKLTAEGTILTWGIVRPFLPIAGLRYTHQMWYSVPDWARLDILRSAFADAATQGSETAALQARCNSAVVPGSRVSILTRHIAWAGPGGFTSRPAKFLHYTFMQALPGKTEQATQLFLDLARDLYAKLMREDVILGYGLIMQELKAMPTPTHTIWYSVTDLGGIDRVERAFDRTIRQRLAGKFRENVFDQENLTQQVIEVVNYFVTPSLDQP